MVTEEEMRSKLKKNPHPYANEKKSPKPKPAKKPLKPNAKDGDYANFSFKKGRSIKHAVSVKLKDWLNDWLIDWLSEWVSEWFDGVLRRFGNISAI